MQENVDESVAQDRLVRKEKKRTDRSELEIVKIQEKFGTKHQRPCALCEQSFSEVNLVLAVPFKVSPAVFRAIHSKVPSYRLDASILHKRMAV